MSTSRRVRIARALYRALLHLAPPATRRDYGTEMRATFDALSERAGAGGVWALVRLLSQETSDLLRARRPAMTPPLHLERKSTMDAWMEFFAPLAQPLQLLRALTRRPLFTLAVTGTLAFGTGMSTTLFSVVETVLLRPLPYPNADRLVTIFEASPTAPDKPGLIAPARLEDWNREGTAFTAISASYLDTLTETSGSAPERLAARRVTPGYFAVFGSAALIGRTFTKDEDKVGGARAVILSEAFWNRRFARDPRALGRALIIDGASHPIVGVMPRAFAPGVVDVWLLSSELTPQRSARFLSGVARLKPGMSIDQARADIDRVQRALGEAFPETDKGWSALITDLKEGRVGDRRLGLWLVFGAVALVWLIGVANVAGLVLVDAQRRTRELAVRAALGASRARVVGVVTHEVLAMAILGAIIGAAIANGLIALVPSMFETMPRLAELSVNWRALLFAASTAVLAALVCGVVPALHATRRGTLQTLRSTGRGSTTASQATQRWLVGFQVALGVVLCSSAALLASSYYELSRVDPGFSTEGVVTFHVGARWDEDRARVGQMQVDLLSALERIPGVTGAGLVNFLPAPGGSLRYEVSVDGLAGPTSSGLLPVGSRMMSPGYLRALGAPLVAGSWCSRFYYDFDQPRSAMVNKQFVDRYAGGQGVIGRTLRVAGTRGSSATIVGVVGDVAEDGTQVDRVPFVYSCDSAGSWPDPNYVVRTSDTSGLIARLRDVVGQIDSSRAVFGVRLVDDVMDAAIAEPRRNATVVVGFAGAALLLCAVGLYALFARLVAESRREIGVRLALGARPGQIVRMVLGDASRLLVLGVVAGVALSVGAYQLLRWVLFGVGPFDAIALAAAAFVLCAVSFVAILVPASRASRLMPTEALRSDG
ncbi:MAG TPA: ABC transporter permease [Vicinamibacterales bacterium]|nr:ABC transporter permease [Vicinamibacterales bacterium]